MTDETDNSLKAQIERALEAHTRYTELWVTELVNEKGLKPDEIMFYKDYLGNQQWLENLKIRSQLLHALALECQNEKLATEDSNEGKNYGAFYYTQQINDLAFVVHEETGLNGSELFNEVQRRLREQRGM